MRANITDCNVIKCLLLQGGTIEKASSHLGVVENGNTVSVKAQGLYGLR